MDLNSIQIPPADFLNDLVDNFFTQPVKKRSPPYPIYAGCYSFKNKCPKNFDFLCVKYNGIFSLMINLNFSANILTALNYFENEIIPIQFQSPGDWLSLPILSTQIPLKRWEHQKGSLVLSLYKIDENNWSNRFFKATVLKCPFELIKEGVNDSYLLDFDHGITQLVPEKFISYLPEDWKSSLENASLYDYLHS